MLAEARDELRAAAEGAVDAARKAYGDHGYRVVPPAPVVPTDDRTTLFVSAGIQVWRPWVLQPGPDDDAGRLGLQWCARLNSLDRVGASQFLTSFCMLSTVATGPFCDRDVVRGRHVPVTERSGRTGEIERFLDFAVQLGLDPADLVFAVADGSGDVPADELSVDALRSLGVPTERIVGAPLDGVAPFGPGGPAGTEVFVHRVRPVAACGEGCGLSCGCGRLYHFWNLEFLQDGERRVADCAGSLERLLAATSGVGDVYATPALAPVVAAVVGFCERDVVPERHIPRTERMGGVAAPPDAMARVVADHCRTVALLAVSGVAPGPRGAPHVVRRLCRRAATAALVHDQAPDRLLATATRAALDLYRGFPGFPAVPASEHDDVVRMVEAEVRGLQVAVDRGRARLRRLVRTRGAQAFDGAAAVELHQTYGVPPAIAERWLQEAQRGED